MLVFKGESMFIRYYLAACLGISSVVAMESAHQKSETFSIWGINIRRNLVEYSNAWKEMIDALGTIHLDFHYTTSTLEKTVALFEKYADCETQTGTDSVKLEMERKVSEMFNNYTIEQTVAIINLLDYLECPSIIPYAVTECARKLELVTKWEARDPNRICDPELDEEQLELETQEGIPLIIIQELHDFRSFPQTRKERFVEFCAWLARIVPREMQEKISFLLIKIALR